MKNKVLIISNNAEENAAFVKALKSKKVSVYSAANLTMAVSKVVRYEPEIIYIASEEKRKSIKIFENEIAKRLEQKYWLMIYKPAKIKKANKKKSIEKQNEIVIKFPKMTAGRENFIRTEMMLAVVLTILSIGNNRVAHPKK